MPNGGAKRHRRGGRSGDRQCSQPSHEASSIDENNPLIKQFRDYQQQLDSRHDKYERIVKMSRDITIESKRAIFLLHRIDRKGPKRDEVLAEVDKKLKDVQTWKWRCLAEELENEDPYQFLRAYSPGLQEYIEALSMLYFMEENSLISLSQVEDTLCFKRQPVQREVTTMDTGSQEQLESVTQDVSDMVMGDDGERASQPSLTVNVPPTEYILGIADLTGELMRMAIHSVGTGDLDYTFQMCAAIRSIHDAFTTFGKVSRELPRKLTTLRQSLKKVESACYALQIRGSEIPKHMLVDVIRSVELEGNSFHDADDIS